MEANDVNPKSGYAILFAIRTALARCRLSDAPITSLRDFVDELIAAGWDRATVEIVQTGVLNSLSDDWTRSHLQHDRR